MSPARGLAHGLLAAEQMLPLRDWDLAALAAAAHPPRAEAAPRHEPESPGESQRQAAGGTGLPTLH
jgi:hypothetical protein